MAAMAAFIRAVRGTSFQPARAVRIDQGGFHFHVEAGLQAGLPDPWPT
jgi:hypothetical protein